MEKYRMSWSKLLSIDSQRGKKKLSNDLRNHFEKDYHRILTSPSFRRLQDKTQAFPLEKNDFIRTRLTHSIEVSSLAKSMGQSIGNQIMKKELDSEFTHESIDYIRDILASSGLLHDIGNPPFGHFGESTIRDWFKKNLYTMKMDISKKEYGIKEDIYDKTIQRNLNEIFSQQMISDFQNFDGNAQALRLVAKLHFVIDENGMNLTYGLLNTLIKYPVSSIYINDKGKDIKTKKIGYYLAEQNLFNNIVKSTGTYNEEENKVYRHPLTFVLEAADDIAYCTADLEDGVKKGHLLYDDVLNYLETLKDTEHFAEHYEVLSTNKKEAIRKKYANPNLYAIQRWIIFLQKILIFTSVESFITNYEKIMHGEHKTDLFVGTRVDKLVKMLKKMAFEKVFQSKGIVKMEISGNSIINFFLNDFIDAVLYKDTFLEEEKLTSINKKYLKILSDNYIHTYKHYANIYEKKVLKNNDLDEFEYKKDIFAYKLYLRILLVTDYISGMTDGYAKSLYQEFLGID